MKDDKEVENVKAAEENLASGSRQPESRASPNFHSACEFNIAETNSPPSQKTLSTKRPEGSQSLEKNGKCVYDNASESSRKEEGRKMDFSARSRDNFSRSKRRESNVGWWKENGWKHYPRRRTMIRF